jgi:hypothetical protein
MNKIELFDSQLKHLLVASITRRKDRFYCVMQTDPPLGPESATFPLSGDTWSQAERGARTFLYIAQAVNRYIGGCCDLGLPDDMKQFEDMIAIIAKDMKAELGIN